MRSLAWRTSEPKRASPRRRCTSSLSVRAVERQRDLGGERADAQRARPATTRRARRRGAPRARRGAARARRRARACASPAARPRAPRADEDDHRVRLRRAATQPPHGHGAGGRDAQCRPRTDGARRRPPRRGTGRPRPRRGERLGGLDRDPVDLVAAGRGDERGAGGAEHALALERAVLLADQPGHAHDDEPEQHDRRRAHDGVVEIAVAAGRGRARSSARSATRTSAGRAGSGVSTTSRPGAGWSSRAIDGCSPAAPHRR